MNINEQLQSILGEVRSSIPEIRGALVASTDGLAIAHNVSTGDPARLAAMVSTALGLGKRICDTFGGGSLNETSITGDAGQVYVYAAGSQGVLAVMSSPGANVGLIHIECRSAANRVASVLG